VHDTPNRALEAAFGIAWKRHVLPFQTSAKVRDVLVPLTELPTASHAPAEGHETPRSPLPIEPIGLGVLSMRQLVPFQASAKLKPLPGRLP